MHALYHTFHCPSRKVAACKEKALSFARDSRIRVTPFAKKLLLSNMNVVLSDKCDIIAQVGREWTVQAFGKTYSVVITSFPNDVKCTCNRFYDEGVPCEHILKVLRQPGFGADRLSMIDGIYSKDNFLAAFQDASVFFPDGIQTYSLNTNVTSQDVHQGPGAPQTAVCVNWRKCVTKYTRFA